MKRSFVRSCSLKALAAALAVTPLAARAEITAENCQLIAPGDRVATILPDAPSYFAKPLGNKGPAGVWGSWISSSGNSITRIDGTKDPDSEKAPTILVPGNIDPVWAPPKADGTVKWLTLPGIKWYRASDILQSALRGEGVDSLEPALADSGLNGVYQSIALLPDQKTYRAISEQGGVAVQLYYRDYVENGDTIAPKGPAGMICPGIPLKLPMISKTGSMLAGYDVDSQSTKIYQVKSDMSCSLLLDLKRPTGKVEFAFDDWMITSHVDSYITDSSDHGGWFSGVSDNIARNVFVAKVHREGDALKIDGVARMSNYFKQGNGAYYPAFYKDGSKLRIAYLRVTNASPDSLLNGDGKIYAFETVDVESGVFSPYLLGENTTSKTRQGMLFLGALWSKSCGTPPVNGETAATLSDYSLLPMAMSPEGCRKIVAETFQARRQEVLQSLSSAGADGFQADSAVLSSLAQDDVAALCPTQGTDGSTVTVGPPIGHAKTPEQIMTSSCRDCHLSHDGARLPGETHKIDFSLLFQPLDQLGYEDLNRATEWADGSLNAILSGAMPPGTALDTAERARLIDYLRGHRTEIRDQKRWNYENQ